MYCKHCEIEGSGDHIRAKGSHHKTDCPRYYHPPLYLDLHKDETIMERGLRLGGPSGRGDGYTNHEAKQMGLPWTH